MEQFVALFQNVAEQLGMQAARLWPQVVMITFVKSLTNVVGELLIIVTSAVTIRRVWPWAWHITDESGDNGTLFLASGLTAVGVILSLIMLADLPNQLSGTFYPEAATVLRLIGK